MTLVLPARTHKADLSIFAAWEKFLKEVRRASHAAPASVENVGVDHRGLDVAVPQQLLDGADVVARSSRCVANECRSVCGVAGFEMPTFWTAAANAL